MLAGFANTLFKTNKALFNTQTMQFFNKTQFGAKRQTHTHTHGPWDLIVTHCCAQSKTLSTFLMTRSFIFFRDIVRVHIDQKTTGE